MFIHIEVRDVECDEVWSFIGKKQKRVTRDDDPNMGDCYIHVAIERHSKLVLNIAMGKRDQGSTDVLIEGVRHATRGTFQITTDGHAAYPLLAWPSAAAPGAGARRAVPDLPR